MRTVFLLISALILAGCVQSVPNSAPGVGFGNLSDLPGPNAAAQSDPATIQLDARISDETPGSGSGAVPLNAGVQTAALGNEPPSPGASGLTETVIIGVNIPGAQAPALAPVQIDQNNPDISDAQNFETVTARISVEGAQQRREAQKQAYQQILPTELPTRPGNIGPSIVEFALATSNLVGQSLYQRTGALASSRFDRNCAKFTSSDLAQEAFLKAGGPERDRQGLDPDGDGFACFWDPAPFRLAVSN